MPVVRAALECGQRVRMTSAGSSMRPFIRDGDIVELKPPGESVALGDIVLAQSSAGHYVLHRVVRVAGPAFFLSGDAQQGSDGPFDRNAVVGQAVKVFRGQRTIALDRGAWWLGGRVWLFCGRWKPALLGLARIIRALGRGVRGTV
jgi:hypothetical protein